MRKQVPCADGSCDFKRFENLLATKSFSEIVKYAQDADSTVPADMEELDEYLRWSGIAVV